MATYSKIWEKETLWTDIGLCVQNINTILGLVVDTIQMVFKSIWFHENIDSFFNLTTPIPLNLEMTMLVVHLF